MHELRVSHAFDKTHVQMNRSTLLLSHRGNNWSPLSLSLIKGRIAGHLNQSSIALIIYGQRQRRHGQLHSIHNNDEKLLWCCDIQPAEFWN